MHSKLFFQIKSLINNNKLVNASDVIVRQPEWETAGAEGTGQLRPPGGCCRSAGGGEDPAGQGSRAPHRAVQVGCSTTQVDCVFISLVTA